ncbi:MAG: glutathione S-transferase family protein [Pseudomonadota bacterium]|nr:glutathione S-transferase family protein [Pseudomonadota bacterium]
MTLKIWGRPNSTHTQRVLWCCAEVGAEFELILASGTMGASGHVSGGGEAFGIVDTPEYRAMNPNGTIPTIDDRGSILWESNTICRYLTQTYAPELFGNEAKKLGHASQWMDWTNTQMEPHLHILVMHLVRMQEAERDPDAIEQARLEIISRLELLDRHLSDRAYIAGDTFTVGDIAPACAAYRWTLFDLPGPKMRNLSEWQSRIGQRPGFKRHIAPRENHLR